LQISDCRLIGQRRAEADRNAVRGCLLRLGVPAQCARLEQSYAAQARVTHLLTLVSDINDDQ